MKDCPVFISSADSYADLWPVFFDLFKMNWPEYNGTIYLNTEEKTFSREGLNIKCTQVGKLKNFGSTFRAGLDQVESDRVLLMMIDYIFMGKVNDLKMNEICNYFISSGLDSLCLLHPDYPDLNPAALQDVQIIAMPAHDVFSYQIAFWKKEMLYEMALPHENPWTSEWYGSQRANKMNIRIGCLSKEAIQPIPYDPAGCFHQGKWLENAIEYLDAINYPVDVRKRGYYNSSTTIKKRINVRWMLVRDGLKGSYWDLCKRKSNGVTPKEKPVSANRFAQ